jgi:hypothetical protein
MISCRPDCFSRVRSYRIVTLIIDERICCNGQCASERLGVTRRNVFSLASCPSPGFYAISRQTVVNIADKQAHLH